MTALVCKSVSFLCLLLLYVLPLNASVQLWYKCQTKCYRLGDRKMSFDDAKSYCRALSTSSRHVDFLKLREQTVGSTLAKCQLHIDANKHYWINKLSSVCRVIAFSGQTAQFRTVSCSSAHHPFCETGDTRLCRSGNTSGGTSTDWVRIGGQGPSYKLSDYAFPYCTALWYCTGLMQANIAENGTYTFMAILGSKLGLSQIQRLQFWIASPGTPCPSHTNDKGLVMHYIGPLVHTVELKPVSKEFRVLCVKNSTATTTTTTQTTLTTAMANETTPSSTTTTMAIPQPTTMRTSSPTQITMTTTPIRTPSPFTSKIPSTLTNKTNRPKTALPTPKGSSTIQTPEHTTTTTKSSSPTLQTRQVQYKTTPLHVNTQATGLSQGASGTTPLRVKTQWHTSQSGRVTSAQYSLSGNTKSSGSTGMSSSQRTHTRQAKKYKLAVSNTSEPEWLEVGKGEYFVNYNSSAYMQMGNMSVNYFRILPSPEPTHTDSFWIGAHTVHTEEPADNDVTYQDYKPKTVRYSLTNEQVQSLWQELRRQRRESRRDKNH